MNNPDYKNARKSASEILVLQDELSFPIDVEKITLKGKNNRDRCVRIEL